MYQIRPTCHKITFCLDENPLKVHLVTELFNLQFNQIGYTTVIIDISTYIVQLRSLIFHALN